MNGWLKLAILSFIGVLVGTFALGVLNPASNTAMSHANMNMTQNTSQHQMSSGYGNHPGPFSNPGWGWGQQMRNWMFNNHNQMNMNGMNMTQNTMNHANMGQGQMSNMNMNQNHSMSNMNNMSNMSNMGNMGNSSGGMGMGMSMM